MNPGPPDDLQFQKKQFIRHSWRRNDLCVINGKAVPTTTLGSFSYQYGKY
jgi:hypothetical protein